jgi:hypothetical protein
MSGALIECVHAQPATALKIGDKLFDISVDLSSAFSQDCPPISYFRVVLRERLWLRRLPLRPGDHCAVDGLLAVFSTEADEPDDGAAARQVRTAIAGIVWHAGMHSGTGE